MDTLEDKPNVEIGAWLSIFAYIGLALLKVGVGLMAGSSALFADGLNNSTDVVASLAVLIGLRIAKKPADANHRYGHSRAETLASLVASFIMAMVGLQVLLSSFSKLLSGDLPSPDPVAAWTAIASAAAIYMVYRFNLKLSVKTGSLAMKSVALDNRSDAVVSVGAAIGILGSLLGIAWLDGVTAFIVGLIICKTGWDIFREASHRLTDGFNVQELEEFRSTVTNLDGVEHVKDIKGRFHGDYIFVDLTISVDKDMSVFDSHAITEKVESELEEKHQIQHVHVHIEPH